MQKKTILINKLFARQTPQAEWTNEGCNLCMSEKFVLIMNSL